MTLTSTLRTGFRRGRGICMLDCAINGAMQKSYSGLHCSDVELENHTCAGLGQVSSDDFDGRERVRATRGEGIN